MTTQDQVCGRGTIIVRGIRLTQGSAPIPVLDIKEMSRPSIPSITQDVEACLTLNLDRLKEEHRDLCICWLRFPREPALERALWEVCQRWFKALAIIAGEDDSYEVVYIRAPSPYSLGDRLSIWTVHEEYGTWTEALKSSD